MVRLLAALALALVVTAGTAHASGTARVMGMYPTAAPATASGPAPLPMLESKIEVTVRGPMVETVVTQKFQNRGDRAIEATYIFPLPLDAAVSAMTIKTGARTISAAIEKREDAQHRYEAAITAGVSAAVLDQERPDVFTQTVAAIPPKSTVEIVLRYDGLARYADGTWELVLPMVVAPRYVPGTVNGRPTTGTGRAPDTERVPDASRVTPGTGPQAGGATHVAIHFAEPVRDIASPTHELADAKAPDISFTDPYTDHDAVIRWRTAMPQAGWVEQDAGGGFAAVIVEAPAPVARKGQTRVLLILDRAATMRGDANIVSQPLVRALFGALTSGDRVAVIGSDTIAWSAPAEALKGVERAWARQGTALDLTRVLTEAKPEGAAIVLVSDGLVADDANALAAARKLGSPIHVLGVGPAPGRALLTQLAGTTGGTVRFVLPSDDLAAIAKAAVLDVASPPPPLTVTWGTLAASEVVPAILPRLGAGQAMLVVARVKRAQAANARARGELFSIETATPGTQLVGATSALGPLARRWGKGRLDELLLGVRDEAAVTRHALAFGLVSPYTSLVAIGTEVVVQGGVKHSVAVPVSVPAGMHWNDVKRETIDFSGDQTETPISEGETKQGGKTKKPATKGDKLEPDKTKTTADGTYRNPPSVDPTAQTSGAAPGGDMDADGASDEDDDAEAPRKKRVATLDMAPGAMAETIAVSGSVSGASSVLGRGYRASLGFGGGLVLQDSTQRAMIAINLRIEAGRRRNMFGAEGSLWLVDGLHGQGRVLATYARFGVARWFELGAGFGAHFGDGLGPAASVSLRVHLPPAPWVSGYLRYDGALLKQDDGSTQGQNTGTLGVEYGF